MGTGIYTITNLKNGKRYIGSAAHSIEGRWRTHRFRLRHGQHHNRFLQAAWNKYGEEAFRFEVIEECPPLKCRGREQFWMDVYDSWNREHGYNLNPIAESPLGVKHSPAARERKSVLTIKAWKSSSYRQKQIQSRTGRKRSPETRQRMSKAQRARGPEAFEHLRLANIGREVSQETRDKISLALKGRPLRESTKWKMSASRMGHPVSESTRKKISEAKRRVVKETT